MGLDYPTYRLVLYDAKTGAQLGTATVLDSHKLNVGDDFAGYRIVRVRPESTREASHVDVTKISDEPGEVAGV
jgi:hypothetical protein